MSLADAPSIVQAINAAMYGGLPPLDQLESVVLVYVTVAKLVQIAISTSKLPESYVEPFNHNIYTYGSLGALCKILNLNLHLIPGASSFPEWIFLLLEDLSFCFPLMGIIVTMGLDFLWALSSSIDSDILFRRNVSESEFVASWESKQPWTVVALALARYVPAYLGSSLNGTLVFQFTCAVFLAVSFGFIWFCLYKVTGISNSPKFKSAYNKAFTVTALVSGAILMYYMSMVPCFYDYGILRAFILVTHMLETTAINAIVVFFAYLKAPPADLQQRKMNWEQMKGVLNAKAKFRKAAKKE